MNKIVLLMALICLYGASCDAMKIKKIFSCATKNIFQKPHIRNHSIELIVKIFRDKQKYFKSDYAVEKTLLKVFKESNYAKKHRFLREIDEYSIMSELRKEHYRLQDDWNDYCLYKIFRNCMEDFNNTAEKHKLPLYKMIKVLNEDLEIVVDKNGKKWQPYSTSWNKGKEKKNIIMYYPVCEEVISKHDNV